MRAFYPVASLAAAFADVATFVPDGVLDFEILFSLLIRVLSY